MTDWISSIVETVFPASKQKARRRPRKQVFCTSSRELQGREQEAAADDEDLLLFADLDAVLVDFDKNLGDYSGDWNLE